MLVSFCAFYLFVYTGRFNFWPTSPLIKDDLQLTNIEIGIINAMLLWGFMLGDPGARQVIRGLRAADLGDVRRRFHHGVQLGRHPSAPQQ